MSLQIDFLGECFITDVAEILFRFVHFVDLEVLGVIAFSHRAFPTNLAHKHALVAVVGLILVAVQMSQELSFHRKAFVGAVRALEEAALDVLVLYVFLEVTGVGEADVAVRALVRFHPRVDEEVGFEVAATGVAFLAFLALELLVVAVVGWRKDGVLWSRKRYKFFFSFFFDLFV